MDRVAVAQLIFPGTSTEASFCFIFCPCDSHFLTLQRLCQSWPEVFLCHVPVPQLNFDNQVSKGVAVLPFQCVCWLRWHIFFYDIFMPHTLMIGQRAAARPAWVLLTAGGNHGHPLQLGRYTASLHLIMVRAMRFYTLVPRFSADPPTHFATIRWGLHRTRRRYFLSVRRVRQKVLASAGGFWLDRVPISPFHGLPLLWRSCHNFPCPSNLVTGTRHWCLEFWDVCHLSSDLVLAWFPCASDLCQ